MRIPLKVLLMNAICYNILCSIQGMARWFSCQIKKKKTDAKKFCSK